MADESKKYLVNIESNVDEYAKQAEEASKRVEELTVENIKLKASSTATAAEIEKSNAALRVAQTDYRNAKKSVDLATQANKANAGSYEQLYRSWQLAQTQLKLLEGTITKNTDGTYKLSQAYIDQKNKVENAKKALDSFGRGVSDNRLNVGNYTDSIKAAVGELQMMPGPLGQAAGAAQRFGVALKALALNPITLAITAIVGAIAGLIAIFKKFDPIVEKIERGLAALQAIFTGLIQTIGNLISG